MTNETGGRRLLFLMTAEQAEAFARLVAAAERGDGGAACRLGDMYREGLGGLRYSPKETYRWYAKSALAGDANGQNNLGACYEHGLGCAQSYAKAVKWYRLSVAQRLSTASMNLGYCYLRGHGVPADKEEALRLFREAVERGEDKAAHEVERLQESSGVRGLKLVRSKARADGCRPEHPPADTQQVRPCSSHGFPTRDGPPVNLGAAAVVTPIGRNLVPQALDVANEPSEPADIASTPADNTGREPTTFGRIPKGFKDRTRDGMSIALVGGASPPPWEDEDLRRELVDILKAETATPAERVEGPSEEEMFPIFAEGGLKPEDLVDDVAERYAEYLRNRRPE